MVDLMECGLRSPIMWGFIAGIIAQIALIVKLIMNGYMALVAAALASAAALAMAALYYNMACPLFRRAYRTLIIMNMNRQRESAQG